MLSPAPSTNDDQSPSSRRRLSDIKEYLKANSAADSIPSERSQPSTFSGHVIGVNIGSPSSILSSENSVENLKRMLLATQQKLREREDALEKKEHDLVMAAELGNSLLEENERLRARLTEAQTPESVDSADKRPANVSSNGWPQHIPTAPSAIATPMQMFTPTNPRIAYMDLQTNAGHNATADSLEATIVELQATNERLNEELRNARDIERSVERRCAQIEAENEAITRDLHSASTLATTLEADHKRLAKEKAELVKKLKDATDAHEKEADASSEMRKRITNLETALTQVVAAKGEAESRLAATLNNLTNSEMRCSDLDALIEDNRDELEQRAQQLEELTWDLESSRDLCTKLQARLTALAKAANPDSTENDNDEKSLFSEVEDRRQEAENRLGNLSRQHVGLLKTHTMTMHQYERMRNYNSRLTQLAGARESDARVRLLEEALGQVEDEKRDLEVQCRVWQRRCAALKRRRHRASDDHALDEIAEGKGLLGMDDDNGRAFESDSLEDGEDDDLDDDLMERSSHNTADGEGDNGGNHIEETLRARIAHLTASQTHLQRELQTTRLMKSHETEKLRAAEAALREREEEVASIKVVLTRWRGGQRAHSRDGGGKDIAIQTDNQNEAHSSPPVKKKDSSPSLQQPQLEAEGSKSQAVASQRPLQARSLNSQKLPPSQSSNPSNLPKFSLQPSKESINNGRSNMGPKPTRGSSGPVGQGAKTASVGKGSENECKQQ
ncbi:hypothetical protein DFS34DRAFT_205202 [Phlyctochytrium arcticum]|nr:hypothetical protein DFS34DRAFT_205202 [Phlyctochytrium arcticum]